MYEKIEDLKSAICKNGHLQKSTLFAQEQYDKKFCRECSSEIIDCCPICKAMIVGGKARHYNKLKDLYMSIYEMEVKKDRSNFIPKYCHNCGEPYPWTKKFLSDYKEIIELQSEYIDSELQKKIYSTIQVLISERNQADSLSLQKLRILLFPLATFTKELLISSLSNVVVSEALKKLS